MAEPELQPHLLFDQAYYLRNNADVAALQQDPFEHYMATGALELRSPHALFDAKFYAARYPSVIAKKANPLLHFFANPGNNPNPYFDTAFYTSHNPEVGESGLNPLIHFLQVGTARRLNPHPVFSVQAYLDRNPDVANARAEPLSHFLEFGRSEGRLCPPLLKRVGDESPVTPQAPKASSLNLPLPVFCVYGPSHVSFIEDAVLPAFGRQKTSFPIEFHFLNYKSAQPLISLKNFEQSSIAEANDWSEARPAGEHLGFGDAINCLFQCVNPAECFLICNPDSFPMPGCLNHLVETYLANGAGIVEAEQWPLSHPKEFNAVTLETPWASGAFSLISAEVFRQLGGFDPSYFLYAEDVDLSWRTWLSGRRVLHQPLAKCAHATGMYSYHRSRYYYEDFFSLRNFLVIAYKFWHQIGEDVAMEYLRQAKFPAALYERVIDSYRQIRASISMQPSGGKNAEYIKILGLNVFHELR
jgi:hypothetical protein